MTYAAEKIKQAPVRAIDSLMTKNQSARFSVFICRSNAESLH